MKRQAKQLLWLDDHRGQYIPRDFARSFKDRDSCVTGVSAEDWEILEAGPDHEFYWDTWEDVCNNAKVTETDGTVYNVWQDGACWLVEVGAEYDESSDTGWIVEYDDPNAIELTAPSPWASYLINGDASGLEDDEQKACDEWIASVGFGDPVDCVDAGFRSHHDAWEFQPLAGDCQTYTFFKQDK